MKCPLCDMKMEAWGPAAPLLIECVNSRCAAFRVALNKAITSAIRRKLKEAEAIGFNRGHSVAMQQIAGCKELNKEAKP